MNFPALDQSNSIGFRVQDDSQAAQGGAAKGVFGFRSVTLENLTGYIVSLNYDGIKDLTDRIFEKCKDSSEKLWKKEKLLKAFKVNGLGEDVFKYTNHGLKYGGKASYKKDCIHSLLAEFQKEAVKKTDQRPIAEG